MIVIKIGGGRGINHRAVFENLRRYLDRGEQAVVVHGANAEMVSLAGRLGHIPRIVTSVSGYESRYTDAAAMDIFKMAYCGKVNKTLVEMCHEVGICAIGLSGLDGGLLRAQRKKALRIMENGKRRVIRDDLSGKIEHVNVDLLRLLLDQGYLPLICPPAISEEHQAVNVDGDRAAAMIAGALSAETLLILSNVPGLLRDPNDETSLITRINRSSLAGQGQYAKGRMKKKIMGAGEALESGVGKVILADARSENPIDAALNGAGTHIC